MGFKIIDLMKFIATLSHVTYLKRCGRAADIVILSRYVHSVCFVSIFKYVVQCLCACMWVRVGARVLCRVCLHMCVCVCVGGGGGRIRIILVLWCGGRYLVSCVCVCLCVCVCVCECRHV